MKRETVQTIAWVVFVVCALLWVAYRLPRYIYNITMWVDLGLMVSGAALVVLWVLSRSERK